MEQVYKIIEGRITFINEGTMNSLGIDDESLCANLPTNLPSKAPTPMYEYKHVYDFSFDAKYSIQCFEEFIDYKVVTELSNEISDYHDTSIAVTYVHHGK